MSLLLIVPYGIETLHLLSHIHVSKLLIVPYGIETEQVALTMDEVSHLLIVPYGIETKDRYVLKKLYSDF